MREPNKQPADNNVVSGGNTAPNSEEFLSSIAVIRELLNHPDLGLRLEALDRTLNYGDAGQSFLEEILQNPSKILRRRARWLLSKSSAEKISSPPLPWNLTERFATYTGYKCEYATRFANREVREFEGGEIEVNAENVAYAIRCDYEDEENTLAERLTALIQRVGGSNLEALVFGAWDISDSVCTGDSSSQGLVDLLVSLRHRLSNLKALFIGDINYQECEVSWLVQSDMSPILQAYPQLEMLQVRGGQDLQFLPVAAEGDLSRHESFKALVVETGGLSRQTLQEICSWDFPKLEHLELWFGSDNYGGDCQTSDLKPILTDLKFPNLSQTVAKGDIPGQISLIHQIFRVAA